MLTFKLFTPPDEPWRRVHINPDFVACVEEKNSAYGLLAMIHLSTGQSYLVDDYESSVGTQISLAQREARHERTKP